MEAQCSSAHVPLEDLRFTAKIDYLTIETPGRCELPPLKGVVKWPRSAHGKRLSVHDAAASDVASLCKTLGTAKLLELEIAVDVRPRKHLPHEKREQLLQGVMVDLFGRRLDPQGAGMKRQFRAFYRRLPNGYAIGPFNRRLPQPSDQQLHGGRHDDAQVKCYYKRLDQSLALPQDRHVARVEVRLSGDGLRTRGLLSLADLLDFRFRKSLMPYFRHMRGVRRPQRRTTKGNKEMLAVLASALRRFDQDAWSQAGAGAFLPGGAAEDRPVRFCRDSPTNDRIGQALTRLEKQFCDARTVCFGAMADGENTYGSTAWAQLDAPCMTIK